MHQKIERAVNDLLEAELTAFLGYDTYARSGWNLGNSRNGAYYCKIDTQFGEIEIQVPRDRNGKFHQHTLPDYKQHSDVLEDMVIKLYSKGVTTREIADLRCTAAITVPDRYKTFLNKWFLKSKPIINAA